MKEPDKRGRSAVPADNMQKYENYKEQFKRLIHALLKQQLAHNEVRRLAEQGNELAKTLRSRTKSHNRVADRNRGPERSGACADRLTKGGV